MLSYGTWEACPRLQHVPTITAAIIETVRRSLAPPLPTQTKIVTTVDGEVVASALVDGATKMTKTRKGTTDGATVIAGVAVGKLTD